MQPERMPSKWRISLISLLALPFCFGLGWYARGWNFENDVQTTAEQIVSAVNGVIDPDTGMIMGNHGLIERQRALENETPANKQRRKEFFATLISNGKLTETHDGSLVNDRSHTAIGIGMDKSDVIAILSDTGASDIGSGMQTMALMAGKGNAKGWMWSLDNPSLSIETRYVDGKLAQLNVWDWAKRKQTSYHHTMEYHEVSELTIDTGRGKHAMKILKTHNRESD